MRRHLGLVVVVVAGEVEQWGYDGSAINLVEDDDLVPGASSTGTWTMHGFDAAPTETVCE
jgi:hypothetical protein